ncbi:hypothetical protein SAMN06297251_1444 [Fulvimarina manganoxydans]|uniref:Nucleotidyltransferase domain-containing protein n=1 Tax=Fulvimarina manganoxydans TaxID=937218 RepID=A0A1W2EYY9_9HYPH|nr:nucleotidyltransferase [Fulvimarina manganoxydans]SMD14909.1 hypothetical protein SAMN06297251_1444 [Fulvimarina manganoxydans]
MTAYEYLRSILTRETVDTGLYSPANVVEGYIRPVITQWAQQYLVGFEPSGSLAKGTANRSGTDVDFFISLHPDTPGTLKQIYDKLFALMHGTEYGAREQNVSIGTKVVGYDVDLVPGRLRSLQRTDHSLYRRNAGTWTQTDIRVHVSQVSRSPYRDEIRLTKLWRNQNGIDFPSFYLELTVMNALQGKPAGNLPDNFLSVLEYLRNRLPNARVVDPANTNNIISDDLTAAGKQTIALLAEASREKRTWGEIVQ